MRSSSALSFPFPFPVPDESSLSFGRVWATAEPEPEGLVDVVVSFACAMALLMKRVAAALSIASCPVYGQ